MIESGATLLQSGSLNIVIHHHVVVSSAISWTLFKHISKTSKLSTSFDFMKPEYCRGKMSADEAAQLRRGPWTLEEDTLLIQYIASHGEGHWNLLARCSGLKRNGKSCRLRWLNYLKPDVKRGNLTPQEKSIISELHSKWGNRWSKIALHLPGRTDNEIKNYWRTRTQNQARQLKRTESDRFLESVINFCVPIVNQTTEDTTTATKEPENSKNDHDHYCTSLSSPQRNTTFQSQDGSSSNSTLQVAEQPYKPTSPRKNADIDLYNHKYPSDPECYYTLEELRFATMSPIGADNSGLFPSCQEAGYNLMDQEDEMTDSAWNTDELWQFR